MITFLKMLAVIGAILADALLNLSRAIDLGDSIYTTGAWCAMAVVFAVSPALISTYPDKRASTIGLWSCIGSFLFSVWAIDSMLVQKYHKSNESTGAQLELLYTQLKDLDKSTEARRKACSSRPAHLCDSLALERQISNERQAINDQIIAAKNVTPMSEFDRNMAMVLMCVFALLLQIIAAEFSRQLSSSGSKPRNREPEQAKIEQKPEPVKKKVGTALSSQKLKGSKSRVPDAKQKQQLDHAYMAMKRSGAKITQQDLGKEARVSKATAAWYLNNCELPNVIKIQMEDMKK